jgi:hypothetical protein
MFIWDALSSILIPWFPPEKLIDLLFKLNTSYTHVADTSHPGDTSPTLIHPTFHPLVNFPLAYTVTVILKCAYFVFTFHTLSPQNTMDAMLHALVTIHRASRNTSADPTHWDGCSHTFQPTSVIISVDSPSLHYALCTGTCMKLKLYLYWNLTFSHLIYSKACKFFSRYLISLT